MNKKILLQDLTLPFESFKIKSELIQFLKSDVGWHFKNHSELL
jgi:hypothetical protein